MSDAEIPEAVLGLLRQTVQSWLVAEQSRSAMRQKILAMLKEIEAGAVLILALKKGADPSLLDTLQRAYDRAVLERKSHERSPDEETACPNGPSSPGGA